MFINKKDRYHQVLSKKFGIVREIIEYLPEADDPRIYIVAGISCKSDYLGANECNRSNSAAGFTYEHACNAAVSECVERYCSAFYNDIIFGSYNALKQNNNIIEPEKFAFYLEEQYKQKKFPFDRFDRDTYIGWTLGYNFTTNRDVLVPAASVYLPYKPQENEARIWNCVSTGLSCATSYEEAVLKGIYEVLERDAFSMTWLHKISFPRIMFCDDEEIGLLYKKYFEVENCDYYLMELNNGFNIPTVLGVFDDRKGGALVAASTRANKREAVKKTLLELSQGRIAWKKDFVEGHDITIEEGYRNIKELEQHVMLYSNKEMKKHLKFAYETDEVTDFSDTKTFSNIKEELSYVLQQITKQGYDVIAVDLTTEDVRELDFRVVRVLIPGMTELTVDHEYPCIGGRRLYEVPYKLGLKKEIAKVEDLNKVPHPFP